MIAPPMIPNIVIAIVCIEAKYDRFLGDQSCVTYIKL